MSFRFSKIEQVDVVRLFLGKNSLNGMCVSGDVINEGNIPFDLPHTCEISSKQA